MHVVFAQDRLESLKRSQLIITGRRVAQASAKSALSKSARVKYSLAAVTNCDRRDLTLACHSCVKKKITKVTSYIILYIFISNY